MDRDENFEQYLIRMFNQVIEIRQRQYHPAGAGAALPSHGAAHVGAVRAEFAGILRQEPVPKIFIVSVAPEKCDPRHPKGGQLIYGEPLSGVAVGRAAGAVGANLGTRHPEDPASSSSR